MSKCLAYQLVPLRAPRGILQCCLLPLCRVNLHQIPGTHTKVSDISSLLVMAVLFKAPWGPSMPWPWEIRHCEDKRTRCREGQQKRGWFMQKCNTSLVSCYFSWVFFSLITGNYFLPRHTQAMIDVKALPEFFTSSRDHPHLIECWVWMSGSEIWGTMQTDLLRYGTWKEHWWVTDARLTETWGLDWMRHTFGGKPLQSVVFLHW